MEESNLPSMTLSIPAPVGIVCLTPGLRMRNGPILPKEKQVKAQNLKFTCPQLHHLIEDALSNLCPPRCPWGHEISLWETVEPEEVGDFLIEWVLDHPEVQSEDGDS